MALNKDAQRIVKMDIELFDLEVLYQRELNQELALNKRTLLMSRGIKNRIDKLRRARRLLMAATKNKVSLRTSFAIELAERRNAVEEAEKQVEELKQQLIAYLSDMKTLQAAGMDIPENLQTQVNYHLRDLPRAETIVRNKKRAVENWIMNGEAHALKLSRGSNSRLNSSYNAEEDAAKILENVESAVSSFDTRTVSTKVNTTKGIDLLMNPAHVELESGAQTSGQAQESDLVELTTEELEARELEKMHSTQYKPVVID